MTEIVVPPHSAGPPLHTHDFDEAFYMLEGELIFQVEDAQLTKAAGEASFAPRNVAHTLANHSDAPARYLLTCVLRAPLGAHRRRGGRDRAAAVGAAADPRSHGRGPADRGAGVRPRLAGSPIPEAVEAASPAHVPVSPPPCAPRSLPGTPCHMRIGLRNSVVGCARGGV